MENDDFKKIKKLEKQLTAAVFLFIITIATGAWIIFGLVAKQSALALSGNYSKSSGEQLNVDDWNNLVADFVDASGDIITGPLNLNDTLNHITASPFYINSNNGLQLRINTDGGTDKFNINNNNNDKIFTVTNAGEVGIGTDSPGAKLEVNGGLKIGNSPTISKIISGTVAVFFDDTGNLVSGSGFSVSPATVPPTEGGAIVNDDVGCAVVTFDQTFNNIPRVITGLDTTAFGHTYFNVGAIKANKNYFLICGYHMGASMWNSGSIEISFIAIE